MLAWMPRVDGFFLQDEPQNLIEQDKIALVPTVSGTKYFPSLLPRVDLTCWNFPGTCDDDGTVFSLYKDIR